MKIKKRKKNIQHNHEEMLGRSSLMKKNNKKKLKQVEKK